GVGRGGRAGGGGAVGGRQGAGTAPREPASAHAAQGSRLASLRDEERSSTATLSLPFRFSSSVRVARSRACGENTETERSVKCPAGCDVHRRVGLHRQRAGPAR